MLGTIAALIITILFFRAAQSASKNPISMALSGFLSFFIPALLWTYFITPDLKDTLAHDPSNSLLKFTASYAYVILGSAYATWVWFKLFKNKTPDEQ